VDRIGERSQRIMPRIQRFDIVYLRMLGAPFCLILSGEQMGSGGLSGLLPGSTPGPDFWRGVKKRAREPVARVRTRVAPFPFVLLDAPPPFTYEIATL